MNKMDKCINNLKIYAKRMFFAGEIQMADELADIVEYLESLPQLDNNLSKDSKWKKTDKYNGMIEAFECDFALIKKEKMTFAELDKFVEGSRYSLSEHMCLMQELSYLIRHGKAEIYVKEGET